MAVFIPISSKETLSKYKYIFRLTIDKSVNNTKKISIEHFPIIYINSSFIYFKQNGSDELKKETICSASLDKHGFSHTLNLLFDYEIHDNIFPYYPKCYFFVENNLSIEKAKEVVTSCNERLNSILENEYRKAKEHKEKMEILRDKENLIKIYYKLTGKTLKADDILIDLEKNV